MARTAVVTGGVTGIGAATCKALKRAGSQVVATFYGNASDARKFHQETGIPVYEWSVADFEQWRAVIDVDLGGCFNMCRSVIGGMRERRFGRIVNVSSINGLAGQFGQTNYAAAKAGVIGFTKALALENAARGITVNAIAPGYTDTAMVAAVRPDILSRFVASVPVGRLAKPEEIARGVAFLASDNAGFITGETLSINGGKYMQ
jgi:acetoacetyl-CoA reductase